MMTPPSCPSSDFMCGPLVSMKLGPEERNTLVFMTQYLTVFPWPKSMTFGVLTVLKLNAGICAKCKALLGLTLVDLCDVGFQNEEVKLVPMVQIL